MTAIHHPTLASDALALPDAERASLAVLLIDSLGSDEKPDNALWPGVLVTELKRRSAELKSGQVRGLTSEEVFGSPL
jgi:hypothetical protein